MGRNGIINDSILIPDNMLYYVHRTNEHSTAVNLTQCYYFPRRSRRD